MAPGADPGFLVGGDSNTWTGVPTLYAFLNFLEKPYAIENNFVLKGACVEGVPPPLDPPPYTATFKAGSDPGVSVGEPTAYGFCHYIWFYHNFQ